MDVAALTALLRAVRQREPQRRVILFGSSALLVSLADPVLAGIDLEMTLDADLLLDPDDETARRMLDVEIGSGSPYDVATGFHGDFVDFRISHDFFPTDWVTRLIRFPGMDNIFALSPADVAAAKLLATASTRLNRRMGGDAQDRGSKDVMTVAALLRARLVDEADLSHRIDSVNMTSALMVEAGSVLRETIAAAS